MNNNRKGLEPIEVIIMIAIIGIIVAIAIPSLGATKAAIEKPRFAYEDQPLDSPDGIQSGKAVIVTDRATGKQYMGICGYGLVEIPKPPIEAEAKK